MHTPNNQFDEEIDGLQATDVIDLRNMSTSKESAPLPRHAEAATVLESTYERVERVLGSEDIINVLAFERKDRSAQHLNGLGMWNMMKERVKIPKIHGATLEHVCWAMNKIGFPVWHQSKEAPSSYDPLTNSVLSQDGYNIAAMTQLEAQQTPKGEIILWLNKAIDEFEEEWEEQRDLHKGPIGPLLLKKNDAIVELQQHLDEIGLEIANELNDKEKYEVLSAGAVRASVIIPVFNRRGYSVRRKGSTVIEVHDKNWGHDYEDHT